MSLEKARWRDVTHVQRTFLPPLSHACMCTRMKMCRCDCAHAMCRKNVRATGERMYTSRRTHCSCYYMCTRPQKTLSRKLCQGKMNIRHSMTILTKKNLQFVVWVRNPLKILRLHHSMSILTLLTSTCSSVGFPSIIVMDPFQLRKINIGHLSFSKIIANLFRLDINCRF